MDEQTQILIIGAELSGKTSLAKKLFYGMRGRGLVPLFLRGAEFSAFAVGSSITSVVEKAVREQYGDGQYERFVATAPGQRVVILDDLHCARLTDSPLNALCEELTRCFGRVICFGDPALRIDEISASKNSHRLLLKFKQFEIQAFGYELREALIARWVFLGTSAAPLDGNSDKTITRLRTQVDSVVGRHLIPARPIFILIILQQIEAATPMDAGGASYAFLFEALITVDLARSMKVASLDTKYRYLSDLAFAAFEKSRTWVSLEEQIALHASYCSRFAVQIDRGTLLAELRDSNILADDGERWGFRYPYIFNYFVSRYLAENLSANSANIDRLVASLHRDDYSQILLFLVHLCRGTEIIDRIVVAARALYSDVEPSALEADCAFLAQLGRKMRRLELPDTNPIENRRKKLRDLDRAMSAEEDHATDAVRFPSEAQLEEERASLEQVVKINQAIKMVQILGQILKSRSGTLLASLKTTLLSECYDVGLRALGAVISLMRDNTEELLKDFEEVLVKAGKDYEKAADRAREVLFGLAEMISYFFVSTVSEAVGLEVLAQTFDEVRGADPTAAVALIDARVRIGHFDVFPEQTISALADKLKKNTFATWLLRLSVSEHFFLHIEDYRVRQRVCALLDIDGPDQKSVGPQQGRAHRAR